MTPFSHERSLGTLIAIARTRVIADKKLGATTPPGILALANIGDENSVHVTKNASPAGSTPDSGPPEETRS